VIISVGYRVKSQRGTQFRIWATQTLKDQLLNKSENNKSKTIQLPTISVSIGSINFLSGGDISAVKSITIDGKKLEDKKAELLELLDKYLDSPDFSKIQKYTIEGIKDQIKKIDGTKPLSGTLKRFFEDLGDTSSYTHQAFNGYGVGKTLLMDGYQIGTSIMKFLQALA